MALLTGDTEAEFTASLKANGIPEKNWSRAKTDRLAQLGGKWHPETSAATGALRGNSHEEFAASLKANGIPEKNWARAEADYLKPKGGKWHSPSATSRPRPPARTAPPIAATADVSTGLAGPLSSVLHNAPPVPPAAPGAGRHMLEQALDIGIPTLGEFAAGPPGAAMAAAGWDVAKDFGNTGQIHPWHSTGVGLQQLIIPAAIKGIGAPLIGAALKMKPMSAVEKAAIDALPQAPHGFGEAHPERFLPPSIRNVAQKTQGQSEELHRLNPDINEKMMLAAAAPGATKHEAELGAAIALKSVPADQRENFIHYLYTTQADKIEREMQGRAIDQLKKLARAYLPGPQQVAFENLAESARGLPFSQAQVVEQQLRAQVATLRHRQQLLMGLALKDVAPKTYFPRLDPGQLAKIKAQPWFAQAKLDYQHWLNNEAGPGLPGAETINKRVGQKVLAQPEDDIFAHTYATGPNQPAATTPRRFNPASAPGSRVTSDVAPALVNKPPPPRGRFGLPTRNPVVPKAATPGMRQKVAKAMTGRRTGQSISGYETDPTRYFERYFEKKLPAYRQSEVFDELRAQNLAIPATKKAVVPEGWKKVDFGERITRTLPNRAGVVNVNGLNLYSSFRTATQTGTYWVPPHVADAWNEAKHVYEQTQAKDWATRAADLTISAILKVSPIARFHGQRLTSRFASSPVEWDKLGKVLFATGHGGAYIDAIRKIARPIDSAESQEAFTGLVRSGVLRPSSYSGVDIKGPRGMARLNPIEHLDQFVFGDPRHPPAWARGAIRDLWGLDSRVRIADALDAQKFVADRFGKKITIEQAARQALASGGTAALQSGMVRALRHLWPFATFEAKAWPAEAARLVGLHGLPASDLPALEQAALIGKTAWKGNLSQVGFRALMNYALGQKQNLGTLTQTKIPTKEVGTVGVRRADQASEHATNLSGLPAISRAEPGALSALQALGFNAKQIASTAMHPLAQLLVDPILNTRGGSASPRQFGQTLRESAEALIPGVQYLPVPGKKFEYRGKHPNLALEMALLGLLGEKYSEDPKPKVQGLGSLGGLGNLKR